MQFYILFPLWRLNRIIQQSTILEQSCMINSTQTEDTTFFNTREKNLSAQNITVRSVLSDPETSKHVWMEREVVPLLLDAIGHKKVDILSLIQQQHGT